MTIPNGPASSDALKVVKPLAGSGDVYIYMTDIYRSFPYEWPGMVQAGRARTPSRAMPSTRSR
ncbi:hypothetical protein FLW53_19065 [Microbispora sp. SCL1-1]|nr:hypothetical protein FLW53_19065 [Microbispora sp. SCL1-1]